VTGLVGSGLVLQNNGSDDETINNNGSFAFDTFPNPGDPYDVTVAMDPSNPAQECFVFGGSGTMPVEGGINNVIVVCAEPDSAAGADVFLKKLRIPKKFRFRSGRTLYWLIKVKGDGDTIAQDATVTLAVMSESGVTVTLHRMSMTKEVSPDDDRHTLYPFLAEITCDAPGGYTRELEWTATISAAQNSIPNNDTLTKTNQVLCRGRWR
jgi:hypothetical protein